MTGGFLSALKSRKFSLSRSANTLKNSKHSLMLSFLLSRKLVKVRPPMDEALLNEEKKVELIEPMKYPEEILAKRQLNVVNADVLIIDTSNLRLSQTITCVMKYDLGLFVHQTNLVKNLDSL